MNRKLERALTAPGDRGTISRLRHACIEAAGVLSHMAAALNEEPFGRVARRKFAKELQRGAKALRGLARASNPGRR